MKFERYCLECGERFEPASRKAEFCCTGHRMDYSNRRRARGAMIYDMFMALRYERGLAKAMELWKIMCRMGEFFREEDKRERGGRKSWQDPRELAERGELTRFNYLSKGRI